MAEFGLLNWAIVIAYLCITVAIGLFASRSVASASDFQLGSRNLPWWALGVSVVATYVSALSFLGAPAWAYGSGMAALAIHMNYPLVVFVVVTVLLPFFFNSGAPSIYEYLEHRFGVRTRSVLALIFMFSQVITSASIVVAASVVTTFVTGIDVHTSILIITALVLGYTMVGGLEAVIWTDVLQATILFAGAGVILWNLLHGPTPLDEALHQLRAAGKLQALNTALDFTIAPTVWAGVGAMTLYHITVYGANQMMVQRALAAKNIGDAKKSYLTMGYAGFVIYFLFFLIGALLYVHFKGVPFKQPNEIILIYAQSLQIPGLMGLLAAAILSATMSALSASFNSLATTSVADFYQRFYNRNGSDGQYLWASRGFTLMWGVISIPISYAFVGSGGSILERLTEVGSFFVGAQLATFGLGAYSKHTTEDGLLIGIAASFVTLAIVVYGCPPLGLAPVNVAWPWYVVIGGSANIAVTLLASQMLHGSKSDWHEYTVPGQRLRFIREGLPQMQDGWHLVPGRIDRPVWGLLVWFGLIVAFLAYFQTLG
ncbi:sodium transporter [Novosphingobium fuchskuhlense]|uniref:Sodium transporter n=1 Tax=Novosphingobium fuchskuhlense TaxID=1117702 RepID=A0A117USI9_9SPHN|nr:sodium/solute symporter [Novosphingobium fuchskuhlense]KUR70043.1 sodium transporter [Novosphingobium fuchskuhlense]